MSAGLGRIWPEVMTSRTSGHLACTSCAKSIPFNFPGIWISVKSSRTLCLDFEHFERSRRVFSFDNSEPVIFEHSRGIQPQELFVVDNQSQGMQCFAHHS